MSAGSARIDRAVLPEPKSLCIAGDDPGALRGILLRDCAVACWRRPVPEELSCHLAHLNHEEIDDVEADLALDAPALRIGVLLGAAGYPQDVAVPLARDAAGLAQLHAGLWDWSAVRIRLEWVETDACRRFHADQVTTRLLSSYLGRGTQWKRSGATDDEAVEMREGEVGIFKGRLLAPNAPILHRSPPIGGSGERRLLLVVDPPRDAAQD